ncbi:metallophosphoesterase 1-like [Actinia tenebrosa]|uniref:Metallophosphoesterase 1-like n=1 Tax=Actinia tenebrosa TaxID=6105 RepID=A0A6P8I8P3_ACTTE|nr:metallophosphoesterase 1-like [Actinia tenebrosa]
MIPRKLKFLALFTALVFVFCEWIVYYVVIYQCSWPELSPEGKKWGVDPLRAMFLTDTHLLGSEDGHWFDKLRREWQMERAFQTAITIFEPDVVFVLGDLFDEGMKCSDEEFEYHVSRFHKMFRHPQDMQFHVVVGNHDIGFHDVASVKKAHFERFSKAFNVPPAELLQIKGNVFVVVNSIGLEGDNCYMCSNVVSQMKQIARKINCYEERGNTRRNIIKELEKTQECEVPYDAPSPILIQHYPLYREDEKKCTGVDAPPPDQQSKVNRPKWEVVSQEATALLLESFRPRLVLSGHTHHGCYLIHDDGTPELTIPSFSWRNRNNPSFVMAVITPKNFELSKCFIPQESTVIIIYIFAAFVLSFASFSCWLNLLKSLPKKVSRKITRSLNTNYHRVQVDNCW